MTLSSTFSVRPVRSTVATARTVGSMYRAAPSTVMVLTMLSATTSYPSGSVPVSSSFTGTVLTIRLSTSTVTVLGSTLATVPRLDWTVTLSGSR